MCQALFTTRWAPQKLNEKSRSTPARSTRWNGEIRMIDPASENVARMRNSFER